MCNMPQDWRTFFRKTFQDHTLEAKRAVGGEPYGSVPHADYRAEPGQWLCRNPENGHCWTMSDESMFLFYNPQDPNDPEWLELVKELEPKMKKASRK